ncbi:lytic polysaccharide monooxygenase auxiliary activity family 9 protein [Yinghuangia sp. YIM S09857]|uniref:lytic polysaccharide monooxygenase auxiliary activity family 9 protein n=1 Tax=Yinghuangia sp. YIM S09857 TaxID=3436929 RepID=UPI003F534DA3
MKIRRSAAVATAAAFPLAIGALGSGTAHAHGTSQNPPSRIQLCSTQGGENPENFRLSACKAAKAAVGNSAAPFYDPNAVNIAAAAGRHREIIPDGKLCSAGNAQYAGLDLPRTDWPTTNLPSGAAYTFRFKATAPHKGKFEYYITKEGFDVTKPLKWSDLEAAPIATAVDPVLENGAYVISGKLPKRTGRHLIYVVWQRSDSPEAFYSCSDVAFDASGNSRPPATNPATPPTGAGDGNGGSGGSGNAAEPTTPGSGGGEDHSGHGAPAPGTPAAPARPTNSPAAPAGSAASTAPAAAADASAPSDGGEAPAAGDTSVELARTGSGSEDSVPLLAGTAAAVLAVGAGSLLYAHRRTARGRA